MVSYRRKDKEGLRKIEWRPSKIVFLARPATARDLTRYIELGRTGSRGYELGDSMAGRIHRAGLTTSKFTAMSASEAENGSRLMI